MEPGAWAGGVDHPDTAAAAAGREALSSRPGPTGREWAAQAFLEAA